MKTAKLILSTGHRFEVKLIGFPVISSGELVFTTGMVGYLEAMTDPSYYGQILSFSYPLIGNYGIPPLNDYDRQLPESYESKTIHASAIIVSEWEEFPHHRTSTLNLDRFLREHKTPGIVGIDTRFLTQLIRDNGKVLAKIIPDQPKGYHAHPQLDFKEDDTEGNFFDPNKYNLLPCVSSHKIIELGSGPKTINVLNCGTKWNIVREVLKGKFKVKIIPWDSNYQDHPCSGWIISNGPGDPRNYSELIPKIDKLVKSEIPILGICLGSQLIAMSQGLTISRLPYGHRSHNQPVFNPNSKKGYITSQNHGYVVDTLNSDWVPWFLNANDMSIEGFHSKNKKIQAIQFHPEACSGPQDTQFIFNDFFQKIRG